MQHRVGGRTLKEGELHGARKIHEVQQIAFLHSEDNRYSVRFGKELVVKGSREPELDLARVLLARGITGTVTLRDGSTGKPRTTIQIERAALLSVEEGPNGPRFVKRHKTCVARSQTGEIGPQTKFGPLSEEAA
jgi:hypothetical protein